ncbi:MAG: hypothetical protein WBG69_06770 [Arcobacteraceae bacterium]
MSQIYYITPNDIADKNILFNFIYENMEINYYYSDDFSLDFYIKLARAGFISVSHTQDNTQFLLPEMQFEYAVLDFQNLHISKKVQKLLNTPHLYSFSINQDLDGVLNGISKSHQDNWISNEYLEMLKKLKKYKEEYSNFELLSCELVCKETNRLIAGEVGYKIGSTYTSLSGFTTSEKCYNNYGKLQLTLLSKYLESNNYSFWNLGHPYMQYKLDLGAKILSRKEFLKRWLIAIK